MKNSATTFAKRSVEPTPCNSKNTKALLKLLGLYQRFTSGRIAPCRFYPSCSNYALEAVQVHGAARGSWLAIRRVLRCRPLGPHGIDLVPEPKQARSSQSCTQ